MDRAVWAVWYDLNEGSEAEYLAWFHGGRIPSVLSRPGVLWAAHYERAPGGERFRRVVDGLVYAEGDLPGRGAKYLALFGALSTKCFFDPSPAELAARRSGEDKRLLGLRRNAYRCVFTEEMRVDGPAVGRRAPGITPGPAVQMGNFNINRLENEDDAEAWYAQHRLPFMAAMPGCIGARKLLAASGWGKHSILYEYVSLDARAENFVPHEEHAHEAGSWTNRVLPNLVHAPVSPYVGRRIWPEA